MKTFFVRFFKQFWLDEAFFERSSRAVLMGLAVSGVAWAHQIEDAGLVKLGHVVRIVGAILGGAALLIAAGDKNVPSTGGTP